LGVSDGGVNPTLQPGQTLATQHEMGLSPPSNQLLDWFRV
jgi:hypothetical protein